MRARSVLVRWAPAFNARVVALADSPRWRRLVGRGIAILTYTGRRSGRVFTIPVGYRRTGDKVTIAVNLPSAKTWWRNFLGDGGPLSLRIDGVDQTGHAVAHQDDRGRVRVLIDLDTPQ